MTMFVLRRVFPLPSRTVEAFKTMGRSCAITQAELKLANRMTQTKARGYRVITPPWSVEPWLVNFGLEQLFQEIRFIGDSNEVWVPLIAVKSDRESLVIVVDNHKQLNRM